MYFIVDHSSVPPTWYRLDGTVFARHGHATVRSPLEITRAVTARGWTASDLLSP